MLGVAVAVFKPFVLVWAGLNAIDDVALLIRVGRLGVSTVSQSEEDMCGVCDDVMGDLMRGNDGLSAIPCRQACLGLGKCVDMCEKLQEISAESNEFPCIAAGFCDAAEADVMDIADPDCKAGAFFSCKPRRYCRRKRKGLRMTCELKPGIGRWVGMKHAAAEHTVALAEGLLAQAHCGEEGAGPYCIARPTGFGLVAEAIGHFISLVVGGYKSVVAIETPGGSDDRQWLTFWLILAMMLFIERFFARVVLSTFPWYYQIKLGAIVWLVWRSGAETCYRKLRRILEQKEIIYSDEAAAEKVIDIMKATGKDVVEKQLKLQEKDAGSKSEEQKSMDWEYYGEDGKACAIHQLHELSKFILSADGAKELESSTNVSLQNKMLLVERAASVVSFQPRFLRVHVLGTIDEASGELPPMDRNGRADAYVTCRLVPAEGMPYPDKGVSSRTAYRTLTPQWNQELEIPLRGGTLDSDGFFHCDDVVETTQLQLDVHDADVGRWYVIYYSFRLLVILIVIFAAAARIEGLSDDLTQGQELAARVTAALTFSGFFVSYIMAVLRRSDDERIGECSIPIGMLMDQREHKLRVTLREPKEGLDGGTKNGGVAITNTRGGFGIICINLILSEH